MWPGRVRTRSAELCRAWGDERACCDDRAFAALAECTTGPRSGKRAEPERGPHARAPPQARSRRHLFYRARGRRVEARDRRRAPERRDWADSR